MNQLRTHTAAIQLQVLVVTVTLDSEDIDVSLIASGGEIELHCKEKSCQTDAGELTGVTNYYYCLSPIPLILNHKLLFIIIIIKLKLPPNGPLTSSRLLSSIDMS